MPTDDYVIHDTQTDKYVSTYTSPTSYTEADLAHISFVITRTQAECNPIATALNNATTAGRFAVGPRPK